MSRSSSFRYKVPSLTVSTTMFLCFARPVFKRLRLSLSYSLYSLLRITAVLLWYNNFYMHNVYGFKRFFFDRESDFSSWNGFTTILIRKNVKTITLQWIKELIRPSFSKKVGLQNGILILRLFIKALLKVEYLISDFWSFLEGLSYILRRSD